jgi:hypothetical protein
MKKKFTTESPKEVEEWLKANGDTVVEKKYYRKLTAETLNVVRAEFTQNALEIDSLEADKAEYLSAIKESLKPLKEMKKDLSSQVRTGFKEVQGKLIGVIDFDTKMVYFYAEDGELIETETRPAKAEELQQLRIEYIKTGTND